MKSKIIITLFILISVNSLDLSPQIPKEYTIAPWHDFKSAAITYSFDDGSPNQSTMIPILDKVGFKASFNLIIQGWPIDWDIYKQAAKNGHEIASHTYTHATITNLKGEEEQKEIVDSKLFLEGKIGQEVVTLVYPFCNVGPGNYDIINKNYISGRICDGQYIDPNPKDILALSSFGIGKDYQITKASEINKMVDKALQLKKWIVFLIHGIDGDGGFADMESTELESHFNYVKTNGDFWVGTFRDVSKYILEANSLIIEEKVGGKDIEFNVDISYKTEVTKMDFPVTIARSIDGLCSTPTVARTDGEKVKSRVEKDKLIFDVVPGNKYSIKCN